MENRQNASDDRVIFWYDPKGFNDKLTLKNGSRPFRTVPAFEEAHFLNAAEATIKEGVFHHNDLFIAFDGRRSGVCERIRRKMAPLIKKAADDMFTALQGPLPQL